MCSKPINKLPLTLMARNYCDNGDRTIIEATHSNALIAKFINFKCRACPIIHTYIFIM